MRNDDDEEEMRDRFQAIRPPFLPSRHKFVIFILVCAIESSSIHLRARIKALDKTA